MRGNTECVTMRGKLLIAALAFAVTSFASVSVKANGILFDSLPPASDGADSVTGSGPLYSSFSTGSQNFFFNHLDLVLGGGNGGTLGVNLYANQIPAGGPFGGSSIPGSSIFNIANLNSLPVSLGVVSIDFAGVSLNANTRYWLGL